MFGCVGLANPSDFWRRAWVNAVSNFSTSFPQAFRVSQDRGEGMIICGGRQWSDYRVETAFTVHLAEYAGIGVRVQGLRRFYAALLVRPDVLRLVRVRDGETTVSSGSSFRLDLRETLCVSHRGRRVRRSRFRSTAFGCARATKARSAIGDGGVALIIEGGAASSNEILVAPPGATPR